MSKFIEFSTSPRRQYSAISLGNPIHDGELPGRLVDTAKVRVDGNPVQFVDESTPELLLRTLYEMKRLRHILGINCRRFAALMFDPAIVERVPIYFTKPDYNVPIEATDATVTKPVVLGTLGEASRWADDGFYNRHMAFPAQQQGRASYLHKLGYNGPICLSGLQAAMDIYDCTHAYQPRGFSTGQLDEPLH